MRLLTADNLLFTKDKGSIMVGVVLDIRHDNVYQQLQTSFGLNCYQHADKIKRVQNFITKFIRDNSGYREVVRKFVYDAIIFHQRHRPRGNTNTRSTFLGYCNNSYKHACSVHSVILIAAHICQKFNLNDDHQLIAKVLTDSYQCDSGFEPFFSFLDPLVFPFEVDSIIFPFTSNPSVAGIITKRHLQVLEFFLQHSPSVSVPVEYSEFNLGLPRNPLHTFTAHASFVEAPIPSCRGSTPLLLACHSMCPDAVLLLFRYGANAERAGQVNRIVGLQFQHPLYVIVSKLNASVFWRTHNRHLDPTIRDQFLSRQEKHDVSLKLCLNYFCRAMPHLPITVGEPSGDSDSGDLARPQPLILHSSYRDLVPERRYKSPAELAHLSRCRIRQILIQRACLNLPEAIHRLPVPSLIKGFLDLEMD